MEEQYQWCQLQLFQLRQGLVEVELKSLKNQKMVEDEKNQLVLYVVLLLAKPHLLRMKNFLINQYNLKNQSLFYINHTNYFLLHHYYLLNPDHYNED